MKNHISLLLTLTISGVVFLPSQLSADDKQKTFEVEQLIKTLKEAEQTSGNSSGRSEAMAEILNAVIDFNNNEIESDNEKKMQIIDEHLKSHPSAYGFVIKSLKLNKSSIGFLMKLVSKSSTDSKIRRAAILRMRFTPLADRLNVEEFIKKIAKDKDEDLEIRKSAIISLSVLGEGATGTFYEFSKESPENLEFIKEYLKSYSPRNYENFLKYSNNGDTPKQ